MSQVYALGIAVLAAVLVYIMARYMTAWSREVVPKNDDADERSRLDRAIQREIDMEVAEALAAEPATERIGRLPDNVTDISGYQLGRRNESKSVKISPPRPALGREVTVRYRGVLSDAGSVTMRVGYGFDAWEGIVEIPMACEAGVWKASFKVCGTTRLNFCFHDASGGWDDNGGRNWSWDIML